MGKFQALIWKILGTYTKINKCQMSIHIKECRLMSRNVKTFVYNFTIDDKGKRGISKKC